MELLDRYLQTVRRFLPASQKEDIIKELSVNLCSQIEDKEAELGRPLNEAEQASILKEHGNPAVVAGRYRQDQRSLAFGRQLIGPVLFPLYLKVLAFNLGIASIVMATILVSLILSGRPMTFMTASTFLLHLLVQFAIVTLVFTLGQSHLTRYPDRWNPRSPLGLDTTGPVERRREQRVSRFESIAQIVALAIFMGWLEAAAGSTSLMSDLATSGLKLAPIWSRIYTPILVLALAGMTQAVVNLIRPDWTWLRSVVRVGAGLAWLGLMILLLTAADWVVVASQTVQLAENSRRGLENVNQWFFYNLLICAVISAVIVGLDIRRLLRDAGRLSSASGQTSH